jgi:N-acetylglucosaminyl-diphospho-decaprenol L-rhamnosyltransferase
MTQSERGYPLPRVAPQAHGAGLHAELDVVIVTARGSWALLDDCLRSLRQHPPSRTIAVRVVDNASDDGTVANTRSHFPEVDTEELPDNRGFAYACNHAIRRSSAPYVLLLNPDTVVNPGALERLCSTLDRHPKAAVVGPRLVGLDQNPDHNAKRSFPTPAAALQHFLRVRGITRRGGGYGRTDLSEFDSGRVDAVSGSCMLVRRAAIAEVGLLDHGYFMYGEDLDWCRRFGQGGWEVRYDGGATVVHVKHGVTGRHRSLRTNWAFHRSMGRFYRRFDAGTNPALDAAVYVGVLAKFAVSAASSTMHRRRPRPAGRASGNDGSQDGQR